MKWSILLISSIFLNISCNRIQKYPLTNKYELDSFSRPIGERFFYFPIEPFCENSNQPTEHDSLLMRYLSQILYEFKEPILSVKYLGTDMYRLIRISSGRPHTVIRIYNNKDSTVTIWKESLSEIELPRIGFSNEVKYSKERWINLEKKIKSEDFWSKMEEKNSVRTLDGSINILEGHKENRYKIIIRWSPDKNTDKGFIEILNEFYRK